MEAYELLIIKKKTTHNNSLKEAQWFKKEQTAKINQEMAHEQNKINNKEIKTIKQDQMKILEPKTNN